MLCIPPFPMGKTDGWHHLQAQWQGPPAKDWGLIDVLWFYRTRFMLDPCLEMTKGKKLWLCCCLEGKMALAILKMACMPRVWQGKDKHMLLHTDVSQVKEKASWGKSWHDFYQKWHKREPQISTVRNDSGWITTAGASREDTLVSLRSHRWHIPVNEGNSKEPRNMFQEKEATLNIWYGQ